MRKTLALILTTVTGLAAMTNPLAQTISFDQDAAGAVGVWTKADSVTAFDDVSYGAAQAK